MARPLGDTDRHLSPRQVEIIRLLLSGHTTDDDLCVALRVRRGTLTVQFSRIYNKTGARNRTDLVLMCLKRLDAMRCISEVEW